MNLKISKKYKKTDMQEYTRDVKQNYIADLDFKSEVE